ncbi:MAG: hypothetical protein EHM55_19380 [Acidobacteria bacterium]|nr:MAG: hypothetical protein EHM55_19380 [Acidobacteriota bacterium]
MRGLFVDVYFPQALFPQGAMALVLAVAGVYSVIAQVVVQRRRELAIRVTAGYLSARRAADVDSMTALKAE